MFSRSQVVTFLIPFTLSLIAVLFTLFAPLDILHRIFAEVDPVTTPVQKPYISEFSNSSQRNYTQTKAEEAVVIEKIVSEIIARNNLKQSKSMKSKVVHEVQDTEKDIEAYMRDNSNRFSLYATPKYWDGIAMPKVSYFASMGFPSPNDTVLWKKAIANAKNGKQILLQQVLRVLRKPIDILDGHLGFRTLNSAVDMHLAKVTGFKPLATFAATKGINRLGQVNAC